MREEGYLIERRTLAPDWVYLTLGEPSPPPEQVSGVLNLGLMRWLKDDKQIRVRATLAMVENGNTLAIHEWYDGTR